MITRAEYHQELATAWCRHRWSPSRVRAWQDRQLRRLVRDARANVPFFAQRLADVDLRAFQGREDLGRIPLFSKRDHQQAPLSDRLACGVRPEDCIVLETSGATGEALRIHQLPYEAYILYGRRLRAQMDVGMRPWHRRVNTGSQPRRLLGHRLGLFPLHGVPLSLRPAEMTRQLRELRPHYLKSLATCLEALLREHPDELAELRLRGVFTGGEHLPRSLRRRTEEVCGCPVTDFYGTSECNLIAWQCSRCGAYHTCDDAVVVEVVRPDGSPAQPGEEGLVAITSLYSFAMPFIRYLVGDSVRLPLRAPECSVGFGCVESIRGRETDHIQLPSGGQVPPQLVMDALDAVPGIFRYEAIQRTLTDLVVRYESSNGVREAAIAQRVRENCYQLLPGDFDIHVERVEALSADLARKRRFIRSNVATREA